MASRGVPLLGVLQLVISAELYERYVSPARRSTIETWWWAVYVAAAPLLFSGDSVYANVAPMAGLFCTRFVVECLRQGNAHWLLTLLARPKKFTTPVATPIAPLLPD